MTVACVLLAANHEVFAGRFQDPVVVKFSFARPFAANANASRGTNRG